MDLNSDTRFANLYPNHLIETGGAFAQFIKVEKDFMKYWAGNEDPEISERLALFVRASKDGSCAGIWIDDESIPHFVHAGSGSGSDMVCVVAENTVDFLRLLAIGYGELGSCDFNKPLEDDYEAWGYDVPLVESIQFREWVEKTFSIAVPKIGSEILKSVSCMRDETSSGLFWLWTEKVSN